MEKETFKAVNDDDLEQLLENLGVLKSVSTGKIKCKYCRIVVTLNNLAAIFPEGGDVKMVCDKAECIEALAETRAQKVG